MRELGGGTRKLLINAAVHSSLLLRNLLYFCRPVVPVLGRWLSYRNYTIEKAASMSQSIISGVPEPIAPLLPTRVVNGQVQVGLC